MKYVFIPFGFFPIYLVFKLLGFIFVLFSTLFVYIWSLNFKTAQDHFLEYKDWFTGITLNPFYAWDHFLDGIDDLDIF